MDKQSADWLAEIDRRAGIYDATDDEYDGRMTIADYLGLVALVFILTIGFWMWVA